MPKFTLALKILAPILLLVASLHLVLGVSAEVMVGAKLPPEVVAEPTLNNQNRFYGVSYALFAIVLWLSAKDLAGFAPIFKAAMWLALIAGVSRLLAWFLHGAPAPFVIFLLSTELIFPVVLLLWQAKLHKRASELNRKEV